MKYKQALHELKFIKSRFFRQGSALRSTFYLSLALIAVLTFFLEFQLLGSARKSAEESNRLLLSSLVTLSNEKISNIFEETERLFWDETILDTALHPDYLNTPKNFEIVSILKKFVSSDMAVRRVVLVCEIGGIVHTSDGISSEYADLPDIDDLNIRTLAQTNIPNCTLIQTADGELALQSRFVAYSKGYLGRIIVYLDTKAFFASFCDAKDNISVYVDDTLLYSTSEIPISHNATGVISCRSLNTSLTFCRAAVSTSVTLLEYLTLNHGVLTLLVTLLLVIVLSFLIAWITYRPITRLLQSVGDRMADGASDDEWEILNQAFHTLKENEAQFKSITDMIFPHIRVQLLTDLTDGAEMSIAQVRQTLSYFGDPLPAEGHFFLLCTSNTVSGIFNPTVIDRTIHNLENLEIPNYQFFSFPYRYSILTIASCSKQRIPDAEVQDITCAVTAFTRGLPNGVVSSSRCFSSLTELHAVYQELHQSKLGSLALSRKELEQHIKQTVHTLSDHPEEAALTTVRHLTCIIRQSEMSPEDAFACCALLYQSLSKEAYGEDALRQVDLQMKGFPSDSFFSDLFEKLDICTHDLYTNLDTRQKKYLVAAKKYIMCHFSDSELSLNSVADHLGISPSYLSRIFSELCGVRFTQYLNDVRIEKAKELFGDENRLIRDISQEVGFLTIQNFMRVFKRKTGITPSEYRAAMLHRPAKD